MTHTTTVFVKITEVERVGTSRNANPTYKLYTTTGDTYLTQTDGSVGYSAPNFHPNSHRNEKFVSVKLTLTKAGRVVNIEREQ